MGGSAVQVPVVGEKMFASRMPSKLLKCPPATNTRPSASRVWPAQKILSGCVASVKTLVLGFQI